MIFRASPIHKQYQIINHRQEYISEIKSRKETCRPAVTMINWYRHNDRMLTPKNVVTSVDSLSDSRGRAAAG